MYSMRVNGSVLKYKKYADTSSEKKYPEIYYVQHCVPASRRALLLKI